MLCDETVFAAQTSGEKSKLSLANESQYLLVNRASVAVLQEQIKQRCEDGSAKKSLGKYCDCFEEV